MGKYIMDCHVYLSDEARKSTSGEKRYDYPVLLGVNTDEDAITMAQELLPGIGKMWSQNLGDYNIWIDVYIKKYAPHRSFFKRQMWRTICEFFHYNNPDAEFPKIFGQTVALSSALGQLRECAGVCGSWK